MSYYNNNNAKGSQKMQLSSTQFFNPRVGALILGISFSKANISLKFGKPIDPNNTSKPQPGEKRFNYKDDMIISLVPNEYNLLTREIPNLFKGTYEDHSAKDERGKKQLKFLREDKAIAFEVTEYSSRGGKAPTLSVSLYSSSSKTSCKYVFNPFIGELNTFVNFIKSAAEMLPFLVSATNSFMGVLKAIQYNEGKGESKNTNESYDGPLRDMPQSKNSRYERPTTPPADNIDYEEIPSWDDLPATPAPKQQPTQQRQAAPQPPDDDFFSGGFGSSAEDSPF